MAATPSTSTPTSHAITSVSDSYLKPLTQQGSSSRPGHKNACILKEEQSIQAQDSDISITSVDTSGISPNISDSSNSSCSGSDVDNPGSGPVRPVLALTHTTAEICQNLGGQPLSPSLPPPPPPHPQYCQNCILQQGLLPSQTTTGSMYAATATASFQAQTASASVSKFHPPSAPHCPHLGGGATYTSYTESHFAACHQQTTSSSMPFSPMSNALFASSCTTCVVQQHVPPTSSSSHHSPTRSPGNNLQTFAPPHDHHLQDTSSSAAAAAYHHQHQSPTRSCTHNSPGKSLHHPHHQQLQSPTKSCPSSCQGQTRSSHCKGLCQGQISRLSPGHEAPDHTYTYTSSYYTNTAPELASTSLPNTMTDCSICNQRLAQMARSPSHVMSPVSPVHQPSSPGYHLPPPPPRSRSYSLTSPPPPQLPGKVVCSHRRKDTALCDRATEEEEEVAEVHAAQNGTQHSSSSASGEVVPRRSMVIFSEGGFLP